MSSTHAPHPAHDDRTVPARSRHEKRRADLDHDLVAVLGTVAILLLTVLCFLGRTALPL